MKLFMRPTKFVLVVAGLVSGVVSLSAENRTTWEQLPDLSVNGVDILATFNAGTVKPTRNVVLADQFKSTDNGPITGLRFWGSWLNNVSDPNVKFVVGIQANNVSGTGGIGYERPGALLWTTTLTGGSSPYATTPQQMFWNPSTPAVIPGDNTQTLKYDFVNPLGTIGAASGVAFQQVAGTTYWLSIQAVTTGGQLFGWSTRDWLAGHSGVSAVYGTNSSVGSTRITFKDMLYPAGVDPSMVGQPIDLAFALDTPEPTTTAVLVVGLVALLWRRKSVA
jgi:hypothetical protein